MDRDDEEEHSRKNESPDGEKPLKKARFLWEVKGKGHLKGSNEATTLKEAPSCSGNSTNNNQGCTCSKSHAKSDNCCIESFLAKTKDIMERDISDDESESDKSPLESSIENEIPVTLVSAQPKNQDYYLRKWQARQIARGFVDNTINSMLENWVDRPFDAANFVEDCENDGQVEDDAILMAIQSHGLQSGWRGDTSNNSNSSFDSMSHHAMAGSSRSESQNELNLENLHKEEQENESSGAESSSSMSVDTPSSMSNPYGGDLSDPMDILNAAVSVAIQEKGLSYG